MSATVFVADILSISLRRAAEAALVTLGVGQASVGPQSGPGLALVSVCDAESRPKGLSVSFSPQSPQPP